MNKKERIDAVLQGKEVDYVPAAFYYHFPDEQFFGKEAVKAHLDLYHKTDPDFLKIMNENMLETEISIKTADDWKHVKPITGKEKYIQNQLDIIKALADKVGHETYLFTTIHGVFASAFHLTQADDEDLAYNNMVDHHLKEKPEIVERAMEIVAESLVLLTQKCIEAGADGIYYAALGAESYRFTEEQFNRWIRPNDLMILNAAEKATSLCNVLHMCKDQLQMNLYKDYPGAIANWAIYEKNLSLMEGAKLFNRTILGGLDDRKGILIEGSKEDISREVTRILDEYGTKGFILGADCTRPYGY